MMAIGAALVFAGYSIGILGYCWVRGYDVTFKQLWADTWPGSSAKKTTTAVA